MSRRREVDRETRDRGRVQRTEGHRARIELRALREIQREAARERLIPYVQAVYPGYRAARHHHQIAEHLEAVESGEISRLMITIAPRHGKSLLASQHFPAWYFGRNPQHQVIASSYGGELAKEFGRYLRNLMMAPEHAAIFPECTLRADSGASDRWHTSAGGVYVAAGVGGPITGRGAHVLLIDDPVKGRKEAESDIMKRDTWAWYQHDAYSRLMTEFDPDEDVELDENEEPDHDIRAGSVILIQTRWVEDDLAGRLLDEEAKGGDQWVKLHLPAQSDDGMPLWPRRFPRKRLAQIRRAVGERAWNALYQGDPTPDDGTFFKREWIRYYGPGEEMQLPPREALRTYGASDYATKFQEGDWTVHGVIGIDADSNIYVLDWWRGQTDTAEWVEKMLDLVAKWKPLIWAEEGGQIQKSVGPFLVRRMLDRKVYCRREQFATSTDKPTRARSIQGRFELGAGNGAGYIFFPRHAPTTPGIVSEMMKFPNGATDDNVDVLSLFGLMIAGMAPGTLEPEVKSEPIRGLEAMTIEDLISRNRRIRSLDFESQEDYERRMGLAAATRDYGHITGYGHGSAG